jgi:GNAT superfamily N-acetyltransferase
VNVQAVRTYLELRSPDQLRRADTEIGAAVYVLRRPCTVAYYRELYRRVGEPWHWRDRLTWSDDRLHAHLESPDIAVWELRIDDDLAGYFELGRLPDGSVEILYFGLVEQYIGRRLGAAMLTRAADEAWLMGATRVFLNTCTLDSTHALPNYIARGFTPYHREAYDVVIPDAAVTAERS